MQATNGGAPDAGRIRDMADVLYECYLQLTARGDIFEHICVLALFCDSVLGDVEMAAHELTDYSVLPGELRDVFLCMVKSMRTE